MHKNPPKSYLPSHYILRTFEAAARFENFTVAAEELHLTQSAVSRQVKELEETIGAKLFRRTGRRIVLTDAGRHLSIDLSKDLDNIRQTIMRAISAGNQAEALRIACLPGFASRWLVPRLPKFDANYPNIEVNISTRLKQFDMNVERIDLAIHYGTADWPDADMEELCSESLVAVCSSEFQQRHGITHVDDLERVPLLHMMTRPLVWHDYFSAANLKVQPNLSGKYFDQFSMIIAGSISSLGAALLPTYLIEKEISNGSLVLITDFKLVTSNNYFLVTPRGQQKESVSNFCEWMHSTIADGIAISV